LTFLAGVNLPWLDYGLDFGANPWQPAGGVARPERRRRLRAALRRLADADVRLVRWFMIGDGRAGLRDDAEGQAVGLDDRFFADADSALELLEEARLRVVFVLLDFLWCRRARSWRGVRMHGRRASIRDAAVRRRFLDGVLEPLLDRYGRARSVFAWDVINEPEWATFGLGTWGHGAVSRGTMRRFIREAVARIHARTGQAATVGSASGHWLGLVKGLDLDLYQTHWYDPQERRFSLDRAVPSLRLDRPCMLGEYPTRGSRLTPSGIVEKARRSGYAGAWAWSLLAQDGASAWTPH